MRAFYGNDSTYVSWKMGRDTVVFRSNDIEASGKFYSNRTDYLDDIAWYNILARIVACLFCELVLFFNRQRNIIGVVSENRGANDGRAIDRYLFQASCHWSGSQMYAKPRHNGALAHICTIFGRRYIEVRCCIGQHGSQRDTAVLCWCYKKYLKLAGILDKR